MLYKNLPRKYQTLALKEMDLQKRLPSKRIWRHMKDTIRLDDMFSWSMSRQWYDAWDFVYTRQDYSLLDKRLEQF